jgi:hypothetical protein
VVGIEPPKTGRKGGGGARGTCLRALACAACGCTWPHVAHQLFTLHHSTQTNMHANEGNQAVVAS